MSEGPFTAHNCIESEHHREEADKLRRLLGQLEASNEQLAADLERVTKERDNARWAQETLRKTCEAALRERDQTRVDLERVTKERDDLEAHHRRVVDQRNRDWDALMVLIAKAVGTDDDREAAEMGEVDEFDPWHALRIFIAADRDPVIQRAEKAEAECEQLRARLTKAEGETVEAIAKWLDEKARYYSRNKHLGPYSADLAADIRNHAWKPTAAGIKDTP